MAIVGDTFVETSDTALTAHTPTGANAGTGWTEEDNTDADVFEVNSTDDQLSVSGNIVNGHVVASIQPNPSTAEQDIELDGIVMGAGDNHSFVYGRQTAALTFYSAGGGDTTNEFYLSRLNAGSVVDLGGGAGDQWDAGETCKLEIRDASKKAYLDDVEILSNTTDNVITDAGKWGVAIGNIVDSGGDWFSSQRLDNFVGTEVAADVGAEEFMVAINQEARSGGMIGLVYE